MMDAPGKPLLEWICKRIKDNKNALINIAGQTGSGKSYAAMWLAEQLHKMQDIQGFSVDNVAFTPKELLSLVNSGLPKGSVIILDEAGVSLYARDWQSPINKLLVYLGQTFRYRNLIVIFTLPSLAMLDTHFRALMHLCCETELIDFENKRVGLKPLISTQNQSSGKIYRKYLRVVYHPPNAPLYTQWLPLVRQWCYLPSSKLVDEYERKKKAYCDSLALDIEVEIDRLESAKKKPRVTFKEQIPKLLKQGYCPQEIVKELGCSLRTAQHWTQRLK